MAHFLAKAPKSPRESSRAQRRALSRLRSHILALGANTNWLSSKSPSDFSCSSGLQKKGDGALNRSQRPAIVHLGSVDTDSCK